MATAHRRHSAPPPALSRLGGSHDAARTARACRVVALSSSSSPVVVALHAAVGGGDGDWRNRFRRHRHISRLIDSKEASERTNENDASRRVAARLDATRRGATCAVLSRDRRLGGGVFEASDSFGRRRRPRLYGRNCRAADAIGASFS